MAEGNKKRIKIKGNKMQIKKVIFVFIAKELKIRKGDVTLQ